MEFVDQIKEATTFVRTRTELVPEVGIILGTGLGRLGEKIEVEEVVPYDQIPHFPAVEKALAPNQPRYRIFHCRRSSHITEN